MKHLKKFNEDNHPYIVGNEDDHDPYRNSIIRDIEKLSNYSIDDLNKKSNYELKIIWEEVRGRKDSHMFKDSTVNIVYSLYCQECLDGDGDFRMEFNEWLAENNYEIIKNNK